MTEEMQKKYKMQFIFICVLFVGILAFSFYLGGLIQCMITDIMNPKYGISDILQSMKTLGIPWVLIGLFALFGEAALLLAVRKLLRDQEGADTLGRFFQHAIRHQVYGDSHFETPDEYADAAWVQPPEDAYGPILGQVGTDGTKLINLRCDYQMRLNQHIMIVGASGAGKTFTFTKPYAYQAIKRRESIIFTDPDGGLTRTLSNKFRENGYIVRVFNLNNLTKSDGWDCMRVIMDSDNKELAAQIFADTIIRNIPGASDKVQPIYRDGPLSLLKALLLRVATDEGEHFKERTIKAAYDILQNEDESFLDKIFTPEIMNDDEKVALGPYQSFKTASPNLRGNLITNLSTSLNLLQTKAVADVLSTDEIDLTLPGKQPCAYFCQFPDSHDTYKFVVSLFFSMLFMMLTNYADAQVDNDGRLPVPVNFMLDEFPSIGVIPDFDRKMATIRKRGMNVAMIVQDITQLQNNYPTTWTTLQSNCSTFLALGINDQYTADMVTKRIGETTVKVETQQHMAYEGLFRLDNRYSTGEGKRALLQFDELFKLDKDDCLILLQYHNPIFAHKYPHILHPESKGIAPYDISKRPNITDRTARDAEHMAEEEKVGAYLQAHPLSEVDRSYKWMFGEGEEEEGSKKKRKEKKSAHKKNKNPDESQVEQDLPEELSEPEETSSENPSEFERVPFNEFVNSEDPPAIAYPEVDPETGEVIGDVPWDAAETAPGGPEIAFNEEPENDATWGAKAHQEAAEAAESEEARAAAWEEVKAKYTPPAPPLKHTEHREADHNQVANNEMKRPEPPRKPQPEQKADLRSETDAKPAEQPEPQAVGIFEQLCGKQKVTIDRTTQKTEEKPKRNASISGFSARYGGPENSKKPDARERSARKREANESAYGVDIPADADVVQVNATIIDPTAPKEKKRKTISTSGMYNGSGKQSGGMIPPSKRKN